MAFEVVDRDQRFIGRKRQAFANQQADHYAADQAGSRRRGDGIDFADTDIGFVQNLANQARQDFDMGPCGDFGNDATEWPMRVILADDCLRQYLPVASDQRGSAVVAGGFKGQNQCH